MEESKKKCSYKDHKNNDAISYCSKCQIYMCNKCINLHSNLFNNHDLYKLEIKFEDIFNNVCKEENHNNNLLEYYCKTHNQLCCTACIAKIKGHGKGEHKDCDICFIEDIKDEKKNKLKDNIKSLEDLSNKLIEEIKELEIIFAKINENKEKLKLNIQNIFTNIRSALNERENKLLLEVDKQYNNYINEDIIKQSKILPEKVKISLEKGKLIENEWNDNNKIYSLVNDCINIEKNIEHINMINENIKKYKLNSNEDIIFKCNEEILINKVKIFGNVGKIVKIESLILKNNDDLIKFNKLVDINNDIKNLNLLYRSSRDGFNYLSIVNKINNKSNLIFLYLTENKRTFGAFIKTKLSDINLNGSRKYYKDENAFAFSFDTNKIYKILVPANAIAFDSTYYILIGNNGNGNGFYYYQNIIYDKALINGTKIYDFSKNNELCENYGKLTELEILEVIFK